MALSEADGPALASWLATATGADEARIARLERPVLLDGTATQALEPVDPRVVRSSRRGQPGGQRRAVRLAQRHRPLA